MADIHYTPAFRHTDWFNNVDRVDAEGPNGFNVRFHAIESDLQGVSTVVTQIDTELDRLGTPPAPVQRTLTLPPVFTPLGGGLQPWVPNSNGSVSPGVGRPADGVMTPLLPDGVQLLSMHVIGFTAGNTIGVTLSRFPIRSPGEESLGSTQITRGANARFDVTIPVDAGLARVDLNTSRYAIRAIASSFPSPDVATAQLDAFQFVYIAD